MDGNIDKDGMKDQWTKEDDSYYLAMRQRVCGLPEFHENYYYLMYDNVENMPVQAIISRRGIEELSVERLFTYDMDKKPVELMSFDRMADVIEDDVSRGADGRPVFVKKAQLRYYEKLTGKDEYQVIPVWLVSHEWESGGIIWHYLSIYDAITGKKMAS